MTERLRGADLESLIPRVAEWMDIPETFVEKDFWAIESLRAVTAQCAESRAVAIFKGGTSLSRAWKLTNRFSEDVDIVIDFAEGLTVGAKERIFKSIAPAVAAYLKLDEGDLVSKDQTRGVSRTVEVNYPIGFPSDSDEIKPHVLLEMGSRGAPTPNHDVSLLSFVAEYLLEQEELAPDEYEELTPFTAHVLAPERTLIEKVALLATQSEAYASGDLDAFAGRGRHFYDVYQLLGAEKVNSALDELGSDGVAGVAQDVYARSKAAGWSCAEPVEQGWLADLEWFDITSDAYAAAARAYASSRSMLYGAAPEFETCVDRIRSFAGTI